MMLCRGGGMMLCRERGDDALQGEGEESYRLPSLHVTPFRKGRRKADSDKNIYCVGFIGNHVSCG